MKITMTHKQRLNTGILRQRGLSLVELMVSLVVGLILIYGVSEIYVNSKVTYNVNEEMSRMQESARFSFDLMVPTVRQTGYTGCSSINSKPPNDVRKVKTTVFDASSVMAGSEYTGVTWAPALPAGLAGGVLPNTDVMTIQSSVGCGANLTGNMGTKNANVQVSSGNTCGFVAGDSIMISDCSDSDLFTATNVSKGGGKVTVAHSKSNNTTNFLSKLYFEDAELLRPTSTTYYIGTGASGLPALRSRNNLSAVDVELVEGVESMQVLYGIDTDTPADGVVNRYVKANAIPVSGNDWDKVIAVRISLLMRSVSSVATASGSYTFDGVSYGADRFIRQEYTSTVQLRNRSLLP